MPSPQQNLFRGGPSERPSQSVGHVKQSSPVWQIPLKLQLVASLHADAAAQSESSQSTNPSQSSSTELSHVSVLGGAPQSTAQPQEDSGLSQMPLPQQVDATDPELQANPLELHRRSVQPTGLVPSPSPQQKRYRTSPVCRPAQSAAHERQSSPAPD